MSNLSNQKDIVVNAKGLTKHFGDFTAVDHVDFEVRRGEIFGFLGPNGSGKTTTIRMALGLLAPSEGQVDILGMKVDGDNSKIRPRVGYMSQRFSLYNDLSVLQNLRFYGKAYGLSNIELESRIQDALEMSNLVGRERTKTKDLSGGWRQRLALGAAILHRPELLFLDEPTAGVDPVSRRAFWDLLYRQAAQGVTVFVTTHYMDEAEHCHRLAFIQRGQIIAYGSPSQIKTEVMGSYQVLELAPSDASAAIKVLRAAQESGALLINEVELYGALVHVFVANVKKQQRKITKTLNAVGIDPGPTAIIEPSLEDVFIASMRN
jgi:ABC-2 type transport system ATP-binding protein